MMHNSASAGASGLSAGAGVGASFAISASGARLKEKVVEFYESIFVKVPPARTPQHVFSVQTKKRGIQMSTGASNGRGRLCM